MTLRFVVVYVAVTSRFSRNSSNEADPTKVWRCWYSKSCCSASKEGGFASAVPTEVMFERWSGLRVCPKCGFETLTGSFKDTLRRCASPIAGLAPVLIGLAFIPGMPSFVTSGSLEEGVLTGEESELSFPRGSVVFPRNRCSLAEDFSSLACNGTTGIDETLEVAAKRVSVDISMKTINTTNLLGGPSSGAP